MNTTTDVPPRPQNEATRGTAREQRHEQSRARYPDEEGFVERDGVRVFWESYGEGEQTLLFLPTWTLVHSRVWKAQIPYFARHFRVDLLRPPRKRPLRPPARTSPRTTSGSSPRTRSTYWTPAEWTRAGLVALSTWRAARASARRGASRARGGNRLHRPLVPGQPPVAPCAGAFWPTRAWRALRSRPPLTTRGWGKFNPHYWAHGGYAGLRPVVGGARCCPSRTRRSRSRTQSRGRTTPTG